MKKLVLILVIFLTSFSSFSQNIKFLLNGYALDEYTFDSIEQESKLTVKLINPTSYKFAIPSVTVIINYSPIPIKEGNNTGTRQGSGPGPGSGKSIREKVINPNINYSTSPSFTFNLSEIFKKYPPKSSSYSFVVEKITSNTDEGREKASNLFFEEARIFYSIKQYPVLRGKGSNQ